MKSRWRIALSILALVLLGGCAASPLPPGVAERFQRVGIVSAIGDEAHFVRFGATVFEYQEKYVPIAEWKLDERAVEATRAAFARRSSRATLVPYSGALPEVALRAYRNFGSPGIETVAQSLRPWAEAERLDTIIIYTKNGLQARGFDNYKPPAWGIGFYGSSFFGGRPRYTSTVGINLDVIDTKEMKSIAQQRVWASKYPGGVHPATSGYAEAFLDNAAGENLELIRREDIELLDGELLNALTRIGL